MSQSLEARLLEPPLCHTFPGKPTCLAYDEKNAHIAVGCNNGKVSVLFKNGQVKVLSTVNENGTPKDDEPVKLMSFCYERTTSKTFLVTSLNDSSQVFLWSLTGESKCVSKFVGDRITVLTWSPLSSTLYVGTGDGDVIMLKVTDSPSLALDEPDESLVSTRVYGEVVTVKESPNQDLVLTVYSTGICWMESKEAKTIDKYDPKPKREPVNAWWKNDDTFILLSKSGLFDVIKYTPSLKDRFARLGEPISVGNSGITKAQRIFIPTMKETVAVCAGGYYVPEMFDKSHVISTFYAKKGQASNYPLKPFTVPVVDFVLAQDKKSNESLLVVLTERINLVSPTNGTFENDGGVNVLRYHRHNQLNDGYPYITPPVTCLHHCGECSKDFMDKVKTVMPVLTEKQQESGQSPELVVTGHSNGSVRLWLCYCIDGSLSFQLLRMIVETGDCFSDTNELEQSYVEVHVPDEKNQKKFSAVSFVKVIDDQYIAGCANTYLLVALESARVLLYRLWQSNSLQSPKNDSSSIPQSQEIILMEKQDGSSDFFQTPSPQFLPKQQQEAANVQLLQHFSCLYQGECGKQDTDSLQATAEQTVVMLPLEPVKVNCVNYNEQMGMLAVGTRRCLAVIDTEKNMLVQVIGSDSKLLKLCLGVDKLKQNCSEDDCDVVCLETAMISWKDNEKAQLTLWVGTRGGSLGVLNLRREEKQVLELKATGVGKHFKELIKEIHFNQKVIRSSKDVVETDFDSHQGKQEIDFYTTNVVVTTEKHFQIFQIPEVKEKSKDLSHKGVMWSGLVQYQGKPFIVCVTMDGQNLDSYSLTNFSHTSNNLPSHCRPVEQDLFSSNGKHAIMKCSDQFYYIMDSA